VSLSPTHRDVYPHSSCITVLNICSACCGLTFTVIVERSLVIAREHIHENAVCFARCYSMRMFAHVDDKCCTLTSVGSLDVNALGEVEEIEGHIALRVQKRDSQMLVIYSFYY